jgi:hypothetical protein
METDPALNAAQLKPRRCWYQFGLRTLLIAVALLAIPCGYVAHEAMIVRERKTMLKLIVDRGGVVIHGDGDPQPSVLRRMLGDEGVEGIGASGVPAGTASELRRIFPETDWMNCQEKRP